ncbi:MAG: hypothetical protein E6H48_05900 [Betaproteobacteria bacterium]|nr:MAG: hypothetical protein E6H48_05900 [Betaproteobacteria bacterium]
MQGGCALQENWTGAGGVSGTSLNLDDNDRKRWHQTWVDNSGGLLQRDGGIVDGAMVLRGESIAPDDRPSPRRSESRGRRNPTAAFISYGNRRPIPARRGQSYSTESIRSGRDRDGSR